MLNILPPSLNLRQLGLAAGLVGAWLIYISFALLTQPAAPVFNSPDETANYVFTKQLAGGQGLALAEPLNTETSGIVRPRATVARPGEVRPVSFLGYIFIVGGLAALVGQWVIPFAIPTLSILALAALYKIWARIWGNELALMSTILAAGHAAFLYFSARGLYHNVLFIDLLIFAIFGWQQWRSTHQTQWLILTLLMVGGCLLVRTSEVIWLGPLIIWSVLRERRQFKVNNILTIAAVVFSGVVLATLMAKIFGVTNFVGYHGVSVAPGWGLSQIVGQILLPFGWNPLSILSNVWNYGIVVFWPLTILTAVGVWSLRRDDSSKYYMLMGAIVTLVLFVFYGSARINDSIGFKAITVGNSFVRYWLPVYLLWLPVAVQGLVSLISRLPNHRQLARAVALTLLVGIGLQQAFFSYPEGLAHVIQRLAVYRSVRQQVILLTPPEAVILSDQSDKLFWPARRVITPGDRPFYTYAEVMKQLPDIADTTPTYLYATKLGGAARAELTKNKIEVGQPQPLLDGAWLYPLVRL
jgi:hypothetical protein